MRSVLKNKTAKVGIVLLALFTMSAAFTDTNKYFEIAKNIEIFTNLYKEINTYYVDDIEPAKLMRTGIDAMLESLDPYTNYISESEIEGFKLMTTGKYGGIGALIRKTEDYVIITEPYEGFPAHKAGMRAGDKLITIDGKSAKGKNTSQVSDILKGSPSTVVEVQIERPGTKDLITMNLKREEIRVPNVPYSGLIGDKIGYIKLTTFTQKAGKNVGAALQKLKSEHQIEGVVLDLRGNGGGLLMEAINVSNIFVNRGEEVVSTKGKIRDWDKGYKTLNKPIDTKIPLVVLIDRGSASASEIVSGVIQDFDRGILIGQKTFGKGLVQNTRDVGYNSKVKLTTAKYYIPSGRCIQAVKYNNGSPVDIPDSLRASFKTRNGRKVLDGGGIYPDIEVDAPKFGDITRHVVVKNYVFDFATQHIMNNPDAPKDEIFQINDSDYAKFMTFIKDKDMNYKTQSERNLERLEKSAKDEKYLAAIQNEIDGVQAKIQTEKINDAQKHEAEIRFMLNREIASRYHLQKGKIKTNLNGDPQIAEALSILTDSNKYDKLLSK